MKFFSLLTLGALLSAANALPTASRRFIPPSLRHVGSNSTNATLSSYNATSFTFIADSNFTEIQSQPLVASGQKFYIGGNSSTYCPDVVRPCPKGGETVIYPKGSLNVAVPGGQQIYVAPNGALSFTVPHSANIPTNSSTGPFVFKNATTATPFSVGEWSYARSGFVACPVNATGVERYQVFVANSTGSSADCLPFKALAQPWVATGNWTVGAWEYF